MKTFSYLFLILTTFTMISCKEKSLQKYLVEKQDDARFAKIDIAPGMINGFSKDFDSENQEVFNRVKKVNFLAFQIKQNDLTSYEEEKEVVQDILQQEKYKDLTRIHSNKWSFRFLYTGTETAIDEIIVFASDDDSGFAIARLLGNKMQPNDLMKIIHAFEKGEIDASALDGVLDIFKN